MKVQVMLNDDLVAQLDDYAKAVGMSRSSLCGFFIGQGMFSLNKGIEMATDALKKHSADIAKSITSDPSIIGQMALMQDGSIVTESAQKSKRKARAD